DINGNLLPGVLVSFTVDNGVLNPSGANTDSIGTATTTLTTQKTSKVTATAGVGVTGASGSTSTSVATKDVTVTVNVGPTVSIGSITSPALAGLPVSVAVTITPASGTTGSPIRSAVVTWGDGAQTQLGSSSGVASHVYGSSGTYTITA